MVSYNIYLLSGDQTQKAIELRRILQLKISNLEFSKYVQSIIYIKDYEKGLGILKPSGDILIYFGSHTNKSSNIITELIRDAIQSNIRIWPVIENPSLFYDVVQDSLQNINAYTWKNDTQEIELVQGILAEINLIEKERKVFICYKREDGTVLANQMFDLLTHIRFNVFLDSVSVIVGEETQKIIDNNLDDSAFLLFLESPRAYESVWIEHEIDYAVKNFIQILVIRFPETKNTIEYVDSFEHFNLSNTDITKQGRLRKRGSKIISEIIERIEEAHAKGLMRRRRELMGDVDDQLKIHFKSCKKIKNWINLYYDNEKMMLVSISPRIPTPNDIYDLDCKSLSNSEVGSKLPCVKLLVHYSTIPIDRKNILDWILLTHNDFHIEEFDRLQLEELL